MQRLVALVAQARDHRADQRRRRRIDDSARDDLNHILRVLGLGQAVTSLWDGIEGSNSGAVNVTGDERDADVIL